MHRHRPVAVIRSVFAVTISADRVGAFARASQPIVTAAPPSAPPLSAQIINMGGMVPDKTSLVTTEVDTLCTKTLMTTVNDMVGVQVGTVAKHTYTYSDKIQYVVSGMATIQLDNALCEAQAGDLIVTPRGVMYGTLTINTGFRSMTIKPPPQRAGDTRRMP